MVKFQMHSAFLGLGKSCLEICFHCQSLYIILLLFNAGFVSQSEDSSVDFFIRSSWVIENIFIFEVISQILLALPVLLKAGDEVGRFVKWIIVLREELFLFYFRIFEGE